jgi:hypothetical protein
MLKRKSVQLNNIFSKSLYLFLFLLLTPLIIDLKIKYNRNEKIKNIRI